MTEQVIPPADPAEKESFTKEEMQSIIQQRVAKVQEQANQHAQQNQDLRNKLEAMQSIPPATPPQPPMVQPPQPQVQPQPVQQQGMTPEQVQEILAQRDAQAAALQQHNMAMDKVKKAAQEDPEFNELAFQNKGFSVPNEYATTMLNMAGDKALPVIKAALKDQSVNSEMQSHTDQASLINWMHQKHAEITAGIKKPDSSEYNVAPDFSSTGGAPQDDDDDEIRSMVANTSI